MNDTIFHMIYDDFNTDANNSNKINNKREQNRVISAIMSSDDSMLEFFGYEADG